MSVNLYTGMSIENDPSLPNWSDINRLIRSSLTGKPDLLKFDRAHTTTYRKFKFAIYHLTILQQVYGVNAINVGQGTSSDPQQWALAEAHSIVFNLSSTLDAVSYEINLAYNFPLKSNEVGFKNTCLEYMIRYQNDALTSYLDTSLYKQDWFNYFIKLRNRMVHRDFTIFQFLIGGNALKIKLPDDPSTTADMPAYSKNIDVAQYCDDTQRRVLQVIEEVYRFITPKIRQRYGI
jgi:hypothetical protein